MELINIKNDLHLFGIQVNTFPKGVKEAFDRIIAMVPDGMQRAHYAISYMEGEKIIYHAACEEKYKGEAEKLNCNSYTVEKGDYLAIKITGWMKRIDAIKEAFHKMLNDPRADLTKSCVEWYKTGEEMICMMKVK
ncbi:MAG: hypothetical protein JNL23_06530 [Chitinophagaceae bacterium]|nr:hypothetical protein [Chitinophagaceae bacterium]